MFRWAWRNGSRNSLGPCTVSRNQRLPSWRILSPPLTSRTSIPWEGWENHEVRFALGERFLATRRAQPWIGMKDIEIIREAVSQGSVDWLLGTVFELAGVDLGNHARHQAAPMD